MYYFDLYLNNNYQEKEDIQKEYEKKFAEYSNNVLNSLQLLNNELKSFRDSDNASEEVKNDINKLLDLEKENYQLTIKIFLDKLKVLSLMRNNEDGDNDAKIHKIEREISEDKDMLAYTRDEITDFITGLKYKYL